MNTCVDVETQFWQLFDAANELDGDAWRIFSDDTEEPVDFNRKVEPTYLAICRLVTEHPAERDVFVLCFSELVVQNRKSPWMLVPFCMRVLRMHEIKDLLHREMDRRGYGKVSYAKIMNYCSSVMHAYQDDVWENAIGFDTFAHERSGDGFDQD